MKGKTNIRRKEKKRKKRVRKRVKTFSPRVPEQLPFLFFGGTDEEKGEMKERIDLDFVQVLEEGEKERMRKGRRRGIHTIRNWNTTIVGDGFLQLGTL